MFFWFSRNFSGFHVFYRIYSYGAENVSLSSENFRKKKGKDLLRVDSSYFLMETQSSQIPPRIRRSVWDYLFYACMLILTIWLILKVIGVIQTPVWLEYGLPIGTGILGFLMFYQSLVDKILVIYLELGKLHTSDARLDEKLSSLDRELRGNDARLETKLIHLDKDIGIVKATLRASPSRS